MSLSLLPTNAVLINQVAVTVYGVAPGATLQANFEAHAKDNGIDATLNLLLNSAGLGTDANFNAIVLANLGLASDAVSVAYMDSSVAANGRLATMKAAFDFLGSVAGQDNVYGTAGTAFNSKVTKSIEYSSVATNTSTSTDAVSATAVATGSTITLTTGTDSKSGSNADDTFNGVLQANGATGTTIQAGDVINGGDGIDTLAIAVAGDATALFTVSAVSTSGVEKVLLNNFDTDNTANGTVVATTLMTGLTTVGLSASGDDGDTVFSGMKNFVDAEMRNGSGDLMLTYDGAQVVTGTADVQNLTVSNQTAGTFTADGIETINLTSSTTKSTLAAVTTGAGAAAELTSLTVSGDADLKITASVDFKAGTANGDTTIDATLDASTFTGKLTVDLADANDIQATGGSGDDTFAFGGTLSKYDIIDGGDGIDTVSITGHTGTTALKMSDLQLTSVETFKVTGTGGQVTNINADSATPTTYTLVENATTSIDADITNLGAGSTVNIENTVDGQAVGIVTLGLKDPSGTSDVITINVKGTSAQGAETLEQIIVADVETVNLSSGSVGSTAMVAADSNVITDQSYSAATNLNITGAANLTMTNAIVGTALKTIDASAFTGDLALTAAAVDLNLKTGSGADTLTFGTTLTVADVIDAGSNPSSTSIDTLTATINELGTSAAPAALQIANVETITLNTATNASFVDASKITGATTIQIENDQNVTLSNLASGVALMLGTDTAGALDEYTGTLDVSLADETGAADALTVKLSKQGTDNDINATLKTAATLETLTIQASTDTATTNDATLNVTNVKSPTIALTKGDASEVVALGTLSTSTTTVDGSAFDGLLSVTASATGTSITAKTGSASNTITGGAGKDTVTILNLGGDDADGAGGTDILNGTIKGNLTEATANFETVNYTVGNNVQSTVTGANGKGVDGATTFNLLGGDSLTTFAIDFVSPASLTKIDYSGYTGKSTASTFAASQLVNTMDIVGSAGTDTVTATTANDNAAVKSMSGVETLKINVAGGATAFDFAKTSGLTKVQLDDDGTARIATLTDLYAGVTVEVEHGVTASGVVIDQVNKTDLDNTQTVEIKTTATDTHTYSIDASDIETLTVKMSDASKLDLSSNAMTTSGKTSTLLLTGKKAATLTAVHTDITTIDASGMTQGGSVTQEARSTTGAVNYTGSVGNDSLIFGNAADVLVGGDGTGDILDIDFAAILGGLNVDLTSTTNQVVSMNGSAPTGTVTGFESVDASGYTGSFGAQITAIAGGSTITGTANVDSIIGGAGADTFTGGGAADTITVGSGADIVKYTSVNGTAMAVESGAATGDTDYSAGSAGDTINGFTSATDKLHFKAAALTNAIGTETDTLLTIGAAGTVTNVARFVEITAAFDGTTGDAVTDLAALDTTAVATGDSFVAFMHDSTDGYLFLVEEAGTASIAASEVTLIGKLVGVTNVADGDFVSY